MAAPTPSKGHGGYGKRPTWQWVLLYAVVGGALYLLIYMLFFRDSGGLNY